MRALLSCFFIIFREVEFNNSLLVLHEILGVCVNKSTADVKYPSQDCGNLQLPIQTQLSEKRKTFSGIF